MLSDYVLNQVLEKQNSLSEKDLAKIAKNYADFKYERVLETLSKTNKGPKKNKLSPAKELQRQLKKEAQTEKSTKLLKGQEKNSDMRYYDSRRVFESILGQELAERYVGTDNFAIKLSDLFDETQQPQQQRQQDPNSQIDAVSKSIDKFGKFMRDEFSLDNIASMKELPLFNEVNPVSVQKVYANEKSVNNNLALSDKTAKIERIMSDLRNYAEINPVIVEAMEKNIRPQTVLGTKDRAPRTQDKNQKSQKHGQVYAHQIAPERLNKTLDISDQTPGTSYVSKPVDNGIADSSKGDYSSKRPRHTFTNSISGTTMEFTVGLNRAILSGAIDREDAQNLSNAFVGILLNRGYHNYGEMVTAVQDPKLPELIKEHALGGLVDSNGKEIQIDHANIGIFIPNVQDIVIEQNKDLTLKALNETLEFHKEQMQKKALSSIASSQQGDISTAASLNDLSHSQNVNQLLKTSSNQVQREVENLAQDMNKSVPTRQNNVPSGHSL